MKPAMHSSLLLLLLPAFATALGDPIGDARDLDTSAIIASDEAAGHVDPSDRRETPTKDAPVDGRDGKPHLGPFVGSDSTGNGDQGLPPLKGRPDDYTVVDGKKIPKTNDGVMFDKNRDRPQEGTTGTEGGVTEKEKTRKERENQLGARLQAQPESPKEQPPLPHSEQEKMTGSATQGTDPVGDEKSYTGFEKPDDLPETGANPPPVPESATKSHLDLAGDSDTHTTDPEEDDEGLIQPFHSFVLSLTMILVSEVGDKTFLVAALMAMKHDRMVVFSAAFGALLVMTVLSAVLGHTLPALLPRRLTSFAAAVLFFVFGGKLLREGMEMDPNEGVSAEMSEVEQELAEKEREMGRNGPEDPHTLEMGLNGRRSRSKTRMSSPPRSPSQSPPRTSAGASALTGALQGMGNLCSLLLSPAWVQTFVMTFLGEWGDRSQIATIAMAAGPDYWWVTLGAMVGHCFCTGAAVIGGRAIAGRVSLKVVTVGGAVAFLVFGFIYLIEGFYA
ncbi:putative Ca2+/H+ antiporter [Emericellopsis cladophorae]|uniref:Ca2+/H+ antiporter n=1 Tax=Emericellopsis cladophorae TaxID=2686198 RepID=A0A9Q0BB49_9HYPO|nr:putative Ca2+/H+ antiporter [Emericellopsis cladophorae]KAI6778912.1 putative Ca2+/H+ antiporter [Emericellopsis cladophorae]